MANINGKLQDVVGGPEPELGSIEVMLCGYGSQVPRFYEGMAARVMEELNVAADGTFSFPVPGNDILTPAGTYYTIAVKDSNGDIVQVNAYIFTDSQTYDLKDTAPFDPNQPPPQISPLLPNLLQIVPILPNLVVNGGFELGSYPWALYGVGTVDTTEAHAGGASLRVLGGAPQQALTLQAGRTYQASAWVMTKGATVGGASLGSGINFGNTSDVTISAVTGGTQVDSNGLDPGVIVEATAAVPWTEITMTFTVSTTGTYWIVLQDAYANPGSATGNAAWFDDIAIIDITPGTTGTAEFDCLNYPSFELTLLEDIVDSNFTGKPLDGVIYTFIIIQNATGGHTFTWPTNVLNASNINPDPNGYTVQSFVAVSGDLYPLGPATFYTS